MMSLFLRNHLTVFLFFLGTLTLFCFAGQKCFAQGLPGQIGAMQVQREMQGQLAAPPGGGPMMPMMPMGQPQPAAPKPETKQDKLKKISDDLFKNGGWWGPGKYFDPIKLLLYVMLFLLWVAVTSWINADQERQRRENREAFNLFLLLLYGVGGTAVFFIPMFWAAFSLTFLIWLVPSLVYVVIRNKPLPPGDKVLTREHLWFLFAIVMGKFGVKIKHGVRMTYESGPPVDIEPIGKGIEPQTLQARLILARNAPGYTLLRENIFDAAESRATALRFDFSPEQTKRWHQVDGTWLELIPVPTKMGRSKDMDIYEEMQDAAKKLVGANPEDRRSKQGGKFKAVVGNPKKKSKLKKFEIDYMTQGTAAGEAAMFNLHAQIVPFKTLDEIGVRPEMQPKVLELINGRRGIMLISSPPTHGLRSTITVFSKVCDRFTRDVANVEDVNGASEPIENVVPGMYDTSKGETSAKPLADLLFRGIAVLYVRDMSTPESVKVCCEALTHDDRLFLTMVRAKDGVDTLQRFLAVNYPAQQIVPHITTVLCQRLIRKLCPECKEAYEPDPKTLQQLRLNPGQVQQLFRKRTPLPPHEEARRGICPHCHGVGYFGRTALFELLTVSDATKALLLAKSDATAVRQQFNKEGQQTFFHEGVRLLLKGETDVDELSRVLKM